MWQVEGQKATVPIGWQDDAGLPLRVGHLRAQKGVLLWTYRGRDVPLSWALLEAANTGLFAVEIDSGAGFVVAGEVDAAQFNLPQTAIAARVASIGKDGRRSPWVSIAL